MSGDFRICISVPLRLSYDETLHLPGHKYKIMYFKVLNLFNLVMQNGKKRDLSCSSSPS